MDSVPPHVHTRQSLSDLRARLGITSKMLAQSAGVSASTITNCEHGKGVLVPKATSILNALNIFRLDHGLHPLSLMDIDWNVRERVHTPEGRAKMSEQRRGERNAMYGKRGAMNGRHQSSEARRKIGEAHKGRTVSEESRSKMSKAKKGKKQSEQAARNNGLAQRGLRRSHEARQRYSEAKTAYWSALSEDERREKTISWTRSGQAHSPLMTKDTKPEIAFEASLKLKGWQLGRDYEKQFEIGSCHADFYLIQQNIVVEIYGCWWHQCIQCGHTQGVKTRKGVLRTIEQIHDRDARRIKYIESKGYSVQVVWSHELAPLANP